MGDKYAECHKTHAHLDGKIDGCQEFLSGWGFDCEVCRCHRNFHRKVEAPPRSRTEVVYTKCKKIHTFGSQVSVDGCQEFTEPRDTPEALKCARDKQEAALKCAICGCERAFHRNEITTYT